MRVFLTDTASYSGAALAQCADVAATPSVADAAICLSEDSAHRDEVLDLIDTFAGTGKPLVYVSTTWTMGDTHGRTAGEMFVCKPTPFAAGHLAVERMVRDAADREVRGVVLRAAIPYGRGGGLVAALASGEFPVIGAGTNHWSFAHLDDLAALCLLALDRAAAGSLYVVAHGLPRPVKEVAHALGRCSTASLSEARERFGPLADALALDQKIGSTKAHRELGWMPERPGILEAIRSGNWR